VIDRILINVGLRRRRIALLRDGVLVELLSDRPDAATGPGDIHMVRVGRAAPALDGVFVQLAGGVDGVISGRHGGRNLNEGQALIAQVDRAAQDGKGPRLTTRVRLPGRFVVLQPYDPEPAVAGRLRDAGTRAALLARARELSDAGDGGVLLRRRAATAAPSDLAAEAVALRRRWAQITDAAGRNRSPALLWRDDVVATVLRDHAGPALQRITVDDAETATAVRAWCAEFGADDGTDVELLPPGRNAIDVDAVREQLAAATQPRLALPGGGWLQIEHTAALTAVDVNAGTAEAGRDGEQLWLQVNLGAAAMLGRQLRLRDIGGPVVVDFIRMNAPGHGERVLAALRQACADDPADVRITGFSEFGLVELTRRRRGGGLAAATSEPCVRCDGAGRVPAVAELADDMVDEIRRVAAMAQGRPLVAAAAPALLDDLGGPALAATLQQRYGCRVELRADAARVRDAYEVWPA